MMQAPITPPRLAANIDLAGGDTWKGLTIESAEQTNCQSDSLGDIFGDGELDNSWGDNEEVIVEYSISTHIIDQMTLTLGYLGTMNFTSPDGAHNYVMQLGQAIKKDGQNFTIRWLDKNGLREDAQELYLAMMHTYAPALPTGSGYCMDSGMCISGNFSHQVAYLWVSPIGIALWVDNESATDPVVASTPPGLT